MGLDDKIKYYLVMRNDVVELGFKNMDRFGADLFCLVMRELRRSIEKNNRNECRFYYWELKEYLNIDDHVSYEMYKKEIDRFRKTILSCWYEFENKEIGVEMVVFMEVINDKKNRMITVKANPDFLERLGINAVLNSGAIELNGKYYLVARIEGNDRKSFFAVDTY